MINRSLYILILIALLSISTFAQTAARWPANSQVKVYLTAGHFSESEQAAIKAALSLWSPPSGITFTLAGETSSVETCDACVTVLRGRTTKPSHLGEIRMAASNHQLLFAVVTLDPQAKSGVLLQTVFAHELGHSLGLDDCVRCNSIMGVFPRVKVLGGLWGVSSSFTTRHTKPSVRDLALLNVLYPPTKNILETEDSIQAGLDRVNLTQNPLDPHKAFSIWQYEAQSNEALKHYSFRREVVIQSLDHEGRITGEYVRISQMVLGDDGRRIERVIAKPKSTLVGMHITHSDLEDFSGAQMTTLDPEIYSLTDQGERISVIPDLKRANGARVFSGSVRIDSEGRISQLEGITLPEGKERFPRFTASRIDVNGNLFPSQTYAEDILHFKQGDVSVRWIVRFSDYKLFGSQVSITEIDPAN